MAETDWYDTRWGWGLYWGAVVATLVGVAVSAFTDVVDLRIPPVVYLFGFLGATVYVFTSFAKQFDRDDRYRLKILSRTVAVLPLAAGVYLLVVAFPVAPGTLSALNATEPSSETVTTGDRLVAGLVFLAGIYVSTTLQALGGLAERLLGVDGESGADTDGSRDPSDGDE